MVRILGEVSQETKEKTEDTQKPMGCSACGADCHIEESEHAQMIEEATQDDEEVEETDEDVEQENRCPCCDQLMTEYYFAKMVMSTGNYGKLGYNDVEEDVIMIIFKCPHCGAVLTDDEDEAKDSLE
jgi:uncharacterized C2H2 Zn-finger protein